jgi:hypothetical protein
MAKRILAVGYAEMKLYLPVEALASESETLRGLGSVSYAPSGHGGNAAVTFAQNGLESVLVSAIGRDPHGETLYGFYKEKGVSLSSLRVLQDKPTALCAVLRDQAGKEKHALYEGASSALTVSCLEKAFNLCPDALYMSLELPEEILGSVVWDDIYLFLPARRAGEEEMDYVFAIPANQVDAVYPTILGQDDCEVTMERVTEEVEGQDEPDV